MQSTSPSAMRIKSDECWACAAFTTSADLRNGFYNDTVYFNNPVDFIAGEHDPARIGQLQRMDIILTAGETRPIPARDARSLAESLEQEHLACGARLGRVRPRLAILA